MDVATIAGPSLAAIHRAAERIRPHVVTTPVLRWDGPVARRLFGPRTEVWLKLELFQVSGSFKARGALNTALQLEQASLRRGLVAFSSGNHAAAVAYAAQVLGTTAKLVMLASANPARIENCRSFGGEVLIAPDGKAAAQLVREIEVAERRVAIHPYEGAPITEGTATISLELAQQIPDLDAIIVAVGGGGLCSGVAHAMKQLRPECAVYAVEPTGADTMYRSFRSGVPESTGAVSTVADSLAPPCTLPYSLGLCRQSVDDLDLVSDDAMLDGMALLFRELKLAVEPGGAASTAAALGPFRKRIEGRRVAVVVCGSNIDIDTFSRLIDGRGSAMSHTQRKED